MRKNDNQIWAFLINQFNSVLADFGYEDWIVLRNYQPSIQGLKDKAVYLNMISKRRIGTQGLIDEKDSDGNWQTVDHWYEEILFQVSGFAKRNPEFETVESVTSGDVIESLQSYINSALKVEDWKTAGYEVIKSTQVRVMDYETDSGLQEKMPQFDFLLVVEQSNLKKIAKIDTIELITKRV